MAAPTIRAVGTSANGVGAISPGLPAGTVAGDLLLMFLETRAQAITVSGWTQLPIQSPKESTGGTAASNTRLTIFYKVAAGGDATTTSDSGDHQLGQIIGITTGTYNDAAPFDGAGGGDVDSTGSTSIVIPGGTTTVADCLVLAACAEADPVVESSLANASLSSLAASINTGTATGSTGGLYVASGVKAAAGTYDATTATADATMKQGRISFAVAPVASGDPPVNTVAPAVTGTPTEGSTLTTTDGTWDNVPTSFTYQWQRDTGGGMGNIGGATANTHVLVAADRLADVRCVVTAINAAGSTPANSNTSADIGPLYAGTIDPAGIEFIASGLTGSYSIPSEGGGEAAWQRIQIGIGIGV